MMVSVSNRKCPPHSIKNRLIPFYFADLRCVCIRSDLCHEVQIVRGEKALHGQTALEGHLELYAGDLFSGRIRPNSLDVRDRDVSVVDQGYQSNFLWRPRSSHRSTGDSLDFDRLLLFRGGCLSVDLGVDRSPVVDDREDQSSKQHLVPHLSTVPGCPGGRGHHRHVPACHQRQIPPPALRSGHPRDENRSDQEGLDGTGPTDRNRDSTRRRAARRRRLGACHDGAQAVPTRIDRLVHFIVSFKDRIPQTLRPIEVQAMFASVSSSFHRQHRVSFHSQHDHRIDEAKSEQQWFRDDSRRIWRRPTQLCIDKSYVVKKSWSKLPIIM